MFGWFKKKASEPPQQSEADPLEHLVHLLKSPDFVTAMSDAVREALGDEADGIDLPEPAFTEIAPGLKRFHFTLQHILRPRNSSNILLG